MQHVRRFLTLILALAVLLGGGVLVRAQEGGQVARHTVQLGETLASIARQYDTTADAIAQANHISNPGLVRAGQALTIPAAGQAQFQQTPTPTATGTPAPMGETLEPAQAPDIIHVVQVGENLFRIALSYNLDAAYLAQYNGIANPRLIYVGQEIRIPTNVQAATPTAQPVPATPLPATTVFPTAGMPDAEETEFPTAGPAPTEGTVFPTAGPPPEDMTLPAITPTLATVAPTEEPTAGPLPNMAQNVGFVHGVVIHLPNQDLDAVMQDVDALGVNWVKQEIDWALYEPTQGAIDWNPLDTMMDAMQRAQVSILLMVSNAPDWARDSDQENGPPTDPQTYASFVGALAERYAGVVSAYEIWSEPNLRREWNTASGISAEAYVALLQPAYTAIKAADPTAVVVTGGLAPTGFNDGVNAIDDRVYLRQMYAAGAAEWSDAIGAHPNGWANPPDSTCCRNNRPAVGGWDDHPSFFFLDTLQDYREIMVENDDSGTYIWATEFGWGSNDGLGVTPPEALGYVEFTSLDEQAQYIARGFQLGSELGYVGPMFLFNLNFCTVVGQTGEQCLFSLLDPAGNPRPAYFAVEALLE